MTRYQICGNIKHKWYQGRVNPERRRVTPAYGIKPREEVKNDESRTIN
jgi:hypothetical protein